MSTKDIESLKRALTDAGVEVYRADLDTIHIAERVRLHIMDAGVRVRVEGDALRIGFTARAQRSDFPHDSPESLFEHVRAAVRPESESRGYAETAHQTVEVRDPVDETKILDVWHELTFEKPLASAEDAVHEIRWALAFEKYVAR